MTLIHTTRVRIGATRNHRLEPYRRSGASGIVLAAHGRAQHEIRVPFPSLAFEAFALSASGGMAHFLAFASHNAKRAVTMHTSAAGLFATPMRAAAATDRIHAAAQADPFSHGADGHRHDIRTDLVPHDWKATIREGLAVRCADLRAQESARNAEQLAPVSFFGEPVYTFPQLPSPACLRGICAALQSQGHDVDLAALALEYADEADSAPRTEAHRGAAWLRLLAIDRLEPQAAHLLHGADACEALASLSDEPSLGRVHCALYAALAQLWATEPAVAAAWRTALSCYGDTRSVRQYSGAERRRLEAAQGRVSNALGRARTSPAQRMVELRQKTRAWFDAMDIVAIAEEANRRGDTLAAMAAQAAQEYFGAERTLLAQRISIEGCGLKPLGHAWERLARALLVGESADCVEVMHENICAQEIPQRLWLALGREVCNPDHAQHFSWKHYGYLAILLAEYAEQLRAGRDETRRTSLRDAIHARQALLTWYATQPFDTAEAAIKADTVGSALLGIALNASFADRAMCEQKPAVRDAYAHAVRSGEQWLTWVYHAQAQGIPTDEGQHNPLRNALFAAPIFWSLSGRAQNKGDYEEAYLRARCAEANERFAEYMLDNTDHHTTHGLEQPIGRVLHRLALNWTRLIDAFKKGDRVLYGMLTAQGQNNQRFVDVLIARRATSDDEKPTTPLEKALASESVCWALAEDAYVTGKTVLAGFRADEARARGKEAEHLGCNGGENDLLARALAAHGLAYSQLARAYQASGDSAVARHRRPVIANERLLQWLNAQPNPSDAALGTTMEYRLFRVATSAWFNAASFAEDGSAAGRAWDAFAQRAERAAAAVFADAMRGRELAAAFDQQHSALFVEFNALSQRHPRRNRKTNSRQSVDE